MEVTLAKKNYLYQTMNTAKVIPLEKNQYWYQQLFDDYFEPLVNYANTMIKDVLESEDLVQNVFLDLWQNRSKIEVGNQTKSYLYRGVYFKCMNVLDHRKVVANHRKNIEQNRYTEHDSLEVSELNQEINTALDQLPPKCKEVFEMSRFDGRKYKEIAEELQISIKTVEAQMGKALKLLRNLLKDHLHYLIILICSI